MAGLGLDDRPQDAPDGPAAVHYQISITGRQAGVFFLLLLAALGLSFFFGMRTGAAARKGPGSSGAVIASASDAPVPTLAPADVPREERKPDDSLGIKPEEKKAAAAEEREARDAKKAAEPAPTPVPPTPMPTAAPAPTHKPAPAAKAAAKPTAKPAAKPAPKGPFYVQILATKNAAAADE